MANDGKRLEALVTFVEETLILPGFSVVPRQKVFEDGVQLAEFDVVVEGPVGSGTVRWLIQCRDRPSEGASPGAWIDELSSRSKRYGFDKVTAVSTTGFSPDAVKAGAHHGVELRTAVSVSPSAFVWLQSSPFQNTRRVFDRIEARVLVDERSTPEVIAAVAEALKGAKPDAPVLTKSASGERVSPSAALLGAANNQPALEPIPADGAPHRVQLTVYYTNDEDHFLIETQLGPVRVVAIEFKAIVRVEREVMMPHAAVQYGRIGEEPISEVVSYAPVNIHGSAMALEFHRVGESGIHVLLRNHGSAEKAE